MWLKYPVTKGSSLHLAAGGKKFEKKNAACWE